ncbi:MAG: PKD domain-containing protein [Methanoculleus sp.]|jgi:PKD repeat protein|uniref:PKD domain-containing protein n=2 Tax=Methanoculleus TaxID=45989 RepID=UPI0025E4A159|nr:MULTISPECIES: PKD domain-containing protein [unclassified Methanoculleus]MCK9319434.1 PKD domain-containing protein [Methanoculleus sp.]MDD2254058.1 PKD domain-containing protein [Methanoculleus sp.]MDD3216437.1 PKD domain-containing protein [Methanoculleus sp.]MDD4313367.1 PKD domain-containing protein [Methanoculleus sp.]MDD4470892.1 PKD domain-containing protein [Methanoculleus sp.]
MTRTANLFLVILILAVALLPVSVTAEAGTTELRIVRYASDNRTVLDETTVDYLWMQENLPVYGDGRTHYYHQGPVLEEHWNNAHPDGEYDPWDSAEDVLGSILQKGDLGAVMGTAVTDLCGLIGGAKPGDMIAVKCRDGWRKTFPYEYYYHPDPRQGPMVITWFNGDEAPGDRQGVGYPDTCYTSGMRMIFFADNSTNSWGWHVFGNTDMKECWAEEYWNYGAQYPSAVGASGKWVSEIGIYTNQPPPAPVAGFEANATADRIPLAVKFNDTSTAHPGVWAWDFGDGVTSTEKNPEHVYTKPGTYTVRLAVKNIAGSASETKTGYITVREAVIPAADFTVNATSGEAPFAAGFTDASSGKPTAWVWEFGDGTVSTEPDPVHIYEVPGTYTVKLAVENSKGSTTATRDVTAEVPVPAPPIVSFAVDAMSGEAPFAVAFTDTSLKSPTAWAWDFGDGNTSNEQNPAHVYASPGVYTVALTATNDLGTGNVTKPQFIAATENGKAIIFRGNVPLERGMFSVTAPSGKTYTPDKCTLMGVLDAAAKMRGFTYVIGDKKYLESKLLFLDGVNEFLLEKSAGKTWVCFHNGELLDDYGRPSTDAFNRRPVADGDRVLFCYGDFFTFSSGRMEVKGGGVNPDDAWAVVDITIGTAGSAAAAAPAGNASASAAVQQSPPAVWLPFLAIGLLLVLRRI